MNTGDGASDQDPTAGRMKAATATCQRRSPVRSESRRSHHADDARRARDRRQQADPPFDP